MKMVVVLTIAIIEKYHYHLHSELYPTSFLRVNSSPYIDKNYLGSSMWTSSTDQIMEKNKNIV